MSNEEKKFDDLLRSKLSERDFFFDELNWQKAEAMLAREEKLRKVKRTYYVFIVGFILGAAVMFPIIMAITTGKQIIASKNPPVAANENKIETNSGNPVNEVASTGPVNTNRVQTSNPTTTSEEKDKNTKASANTTAPVKKATTRENQAGNALNYTYVRPASEKKHKNQTSNPIASNNMARPQSSNTRNSQLNQSQNRQYNNPVAQNNRANNTSVASNNNSPSVNNNSVSTGNANNSATNANNATQVNSNLLSVNNNVSATNNSNNAVTAANNPAQANNNPAVSQTNSDNSKNQAVAVNNNSPQKNDTANNNTAKNDTASATIVPEKYKTPTPSSNIVSADAGAGYSFGWKNQGSSSGNGLSPVIGLSLRHLFSNKWSLNIGIRYNSLTNLKNQYQASSASYDFGFNNSVTSVTTKTLYYGALPLGVQYNFNDKNAVSLGGTLLYLINTKSDVTTTTQDGLKSPTDQTKTATGYMDGFNQWDAQMVIAYRRRLFSAFSVSAEYYYGLMDIEKNSFFMSNTFERNMGFRLILSYDFIK